MQHVWAWGDMHTGFWREDLKEGEHLENPGEDEMIILKWIFKTWDGAWTGLI
jgi:hypothetical protein